MARKLLLFLVLVAAASAAADIRFVQYAKKAARSKMPMEPKAATYFGSAGHEEFIDVYSRRDGVVVAFGNAWGPEFPDLVKPTLLGKGEWYEVSEYRGGHEMDNSGRRQNPSREYPNMSGFLAMFSPDLSKVQRVVKFDWGVATIELGIVAPDDSIYIAGRSTHNFRKFAKDHAGLYKTVEQPDDVKTYGKVYWEGVALPGDVYVAKLNADGTKVLWTWVFEGHRSVGNNLWLDHEGNVVVDIRGARKISPDGKKIVNMLGIHDGRRLRFLGVSPTDGTMIRGGDRNSGTGREPWRKPQFYIYDPQGKRVSSIYDWHPHLVGHDDYRLVSDSSVRLATYAPNGDIIFYGWSDGGNSVFTRQPVDLDRGVPHTGLGMSLWGANVLSACHIIRLNPKNYEVIGYTVWSTYLTGDEDKPNSITVKEIEPLPDGSMAVHGGAASFLVQTPDPWYVPGDWNHKLPCTPGGRGRYVTIFEPEFRNIRFSSAIPAYDVTALGAGTKDTVLVVGRSVGKQSDGQVTPVLNALQGKYAGGRYDAHIILLGPKATSESTDKEAGQ